MLQQQQQLQMHQQQAERVTIASSSVTMPTAAPQTLLLLLLSQLVVPAVSAPIKGYSHTVGLYIFSAVKERHTVTSATECARQCESETNFVCRSFAYIRDWKVWNCVTTPLNNLLKKPSQRRGYDLYERIDLLEDCAQGHGAGYRGTTAVTRQGTECQMWSSETPHKPLYSPTTHPLAALEENFCRNPDNDTKGPWCYTTDPQLRFDYCSVEAC
ncbi:unnamed protein product, partial [Lampetra fluviatilis]